MTDLTLRRWHPHDRTWLTDLHARLYLAEAGFGADFVADVMAVQDGLVARADPREAGWVVTRGATGMGSIFCTRFDDDTGQIRLFLLDPGLRGSGLAERMLGTARDFARAGGATRMMLWTHESHVAACRLYARTGWKVTSRQNIRNYGQDLVQLQWQREV